MNHQEILKRIQQMELKFPVNSLVYEGHRIWPYLRSLLAFHLFGSLPPPPGNFLLGKSWFYRRRYFRNESRQIVDMEKELKRQARALSNIGRTDFLYISVSADRQERVGSGKFMMFPGSMAFFLGKQGSFAFAGVEEEAPFSIQPLIARARLKEEMQRGRSTGSIENYPVFQKSLEHCGIRWNWTESDIRNKLVGILSQKHEFVALLRRICPRAVFFTTYYQEELFALVLACRECKIPSVEIQHGQQGEYSPFDTGFTVVPEEGYMWLPSHFWVWGEASKQRKKELTGRRLNQVVVGGNPWMTYWKNSHTPETGIVPPGEVPSRPGILVALQPVDDPIPDFLIEAVRRTGTGYRWIFRLHPFQYKDREKLQARLSGIQEIEWDWGQSVPLYAQFGRAEYLITFWSTVAYEALSFGLHPVIIHPNGRQLLGDYIEKGYFSYSSDTDSLLRILKEGAAVLRKPEHPKFIETDEELILSAIHQILS